MDYWAAKIINPAENKYYKLVNPTGNNENKFIILFTGDPLWYANQIIKNNVWWWQVFFTFASLKKACCF